MQDENQTPYDPGVPSGPNLPGQPEKTNLNKKLLITGIIVLILAVGGTIAMIMLNEKEIAATDSTDGTSFAAFIPIWIAVFVPFLARRKKEPATKKQKKILAIVFALTLGLVLGTLVFWFLAR